MGNTRSVPQLQQLQQQLPAPRPIPVTQPVPVLTQDQQCKVRAQELSQIRSDLQNKQSQVDSCNPQDSAVRKMNELRAGFENTEKLKFTEFSAAVKLFNKTLEDTHFMATYGSQGPTSSYIAELTEKKEKYVKEIDSLERDIRANRRRFLDNNPQEGVSSILGLRTSDDKILLGFWLTLFPFLFLVIYTVHFVWGWEHNWRIYAAVIAFVWVLTYYVIVNYT